MYILKCFKVHLHSENESCERKSYYKFYSVFNEKSICERLYEKYKILYHKLSGIVAAFERYVALQR